MAISSRIVGAPGALLDWHGLVIASREYAHMPSMSKSMDANPINAHNIDECTNIIIYIRDFQWVQGVGNMKNRCL